jgi:alpha-tubulin suppressor-like RCC1 family protein
MYRNLALANSCPSCSCTLMPATDTSSQSGLTLFNLVSSPSMLSGGNRPAASNFISIFSAYGSSIAKTSTGEFYLYGKNYLLAHGPLGDFIAPTLLQHPGVTFTQVEKGQFHYIALGSNGKVYTWGTQSSGELGQGAPTSATISKPTVISGHSNVLAIGAGHWFSAFIKGTQVYAYGQNTQYNLGDGTNVAKSSPVLCTAASALTVTKIVVAGWAVYAFDSATSKWWAWGDGRYLPLNNGGTITTAQNTNLQCTDLVAPGALGFCLKSDGSLWGWGTPSLQGGTGVGMSLGDGTTSQSLTAKQIMAAGTVKSIAKGTHMAVHMCFTKTDDTLWCFGRNTEYNLGLKNNVNVVVPTQVPGLTVPTLSTGAIFLGGAWLGQGTTCVITSPGNNQFTCFGGSDSKQLGLPLVTSTGVAKASIPSRLSLTGLITNIFTQQASTIVQLQNGETYLYGKIIASPTGIPTFSPQSVPLPFTDLGSFAKIEKGDYHFIGLSKSQGGKVYTWGEQNHVGNGQLGYASDVTGSWYAPRQISAQPTGVLDVCSGHWYSCYLGSDFNVYCFGMNSKGSLGFCGGGYSATGTTRAGGSLPANSVEKMWCGGWTVYVRTTSGAYYTWGQGTWLPFGTIADQCNPVAVPSALNNCVDFSLPGATQYCLTSSGAVLGWGSPQDQAGMYFGDGTTTGQRLTPSTIFASGVKALAKGSNEAPHMCVILTDDTPRCWGNGATYALGITDSRNQINPMPLPSMPTVSAIYLGGSWGSAGSTCMTLLDTRDTVCFGDNTYGQLGNGNTNTPIIRSQSRYSSIGCYLDTAARMVNGWGSPITNSYMTIELCAEAARESGYGIFAVQNGNQCFAGFDYARAVSQGLTNVCTSSCVGDSSQNCGGGWGNQLYVFEGAGDHPGSVLLQTSGYSYVGCYGDAVGSRKLPYPLLVAYPYMTIEYCAELARAANMIYFGLQNTYECYGGTDFTLATSLGTSTGCTSPCTGDSSGFTMCGGVSLNSIYKLVGSSSQVAALPRPLALETSSSASSYAIDQVYISGLTRPVGSLVASGSLSQYRFIWYVGEDPMTSLNVFHPHPVASKNCNTFQVSSSAISTRYMEMGISSPSTSMYVFKSSSVDSEATAKSSVASTGPHRFIGDYACGCGYNDTATYLGVCVYRNECPVSQGGEGTSTCGTNSKCSDGMYGYQCQCTTGYAYDQTTGRAIRNAADVNATSNAEIVSCSPAPYSVLVSNSAIYVTIGTKALNYSYSLYYVDSTTGVALTGGTRLSDSIDLAPGNTSYKFSGLTPNTQYYLLVNFSNSNSSVYNTYLRIPCTCDPNTRLSFDADTPRIDDGKPLFSLIQQVYAKIYFSWTDFSECENSFSPIRLQPLTTAQSGITVSDPVVFSATVQDFGLTPYSLTTSYIKETSADASCSTAYGGIPIPGVTDTKVVSFDDVSRFDVGTSFFYCVYASGPDSYRSGYSCFPDDVRVLWEAEINVQVDVGYPNILAKARSVLVSWRLLHVPEGGTDEATFLSTGVVVDSGDGLTDNNGRLKIHSRVDQANFPTVTSSSKMLYAMTFSKFDVVPGLDDPIHHVFYCNTPFRDCTASDPAVIFASHLSFGEVTIEARDLTTVSISGVVTIDGTENADNGIPFGCPLAAVKVCIYTSPIRDDSVLFGCVYTGLDGAYQIPVTMGVTAEVVVSYNSHKFQRIDTSGTVINTNVIKVKNQPINGVWFKDIQKEQVYADVAGGLCNVSIITNLTLTLERRKNDVCLGLVNDVTFSLYNDPSTTLALTSDFTFVATVPATYLEFIFSDTAAVITRDGSASSSLGVLNYLGARYLGDNLVSLNLTDVDSSDSNSTSAPADATTKRSRRTIRFEYNPVPTLTVSFWQNQTVGFGSSANTTLVRKDRSTGCAHPETTRVLEYMGDASNPVVIRIEPVQHFFDPVSECRYIDGTIMIENLLGKELSNAEKSIVSVQEAVLLETCREWCEIDLLTGAVQGSGQNVTSTAGSSSGSTNSTSNSTSSGTGTSTTPVIKNVTAELNILPIPDIASPYTKYVNLQFRGSHVGEVSSLIQYTVYVLGDALDENAAFTKISFTAVPPIMIVRDPPGDLSYAYYKNVESTINWETSRNEWFEGTNSLYDFKIGINNDNDLCAGMGVIACKKILRTDNHVRGQLEFGSSKLIHSKRHQNKFSRTFVWSVETPHRTDTDTPAPGTMDILTPGPMSDVFVVAIESFFYTETHVIHEPFPGACSAIDTKKFKLIVPPGGAGDFGLGFYTRYDLITRIVPTLEALRDDPSNVNVTGLAGQVDKWYQVLGLTGTASTADVPTLAPTKSRVPWAIADVTLNVIAILPFGALVQKFAPLKSAGSTMYYILRGIVDNSVGIAAAITTTTFGFLNVNPLLPPDLEIDSDSSQVSKFQLLPKDLGLWIHTQKTAEQQALDNFNMIEFSGGGNTISFETSDFLFGEFSSAWRTYLDYSLSFHYMSDIEPFGVAIELDSDFGVKLTNEVEVVKGAGHEQQTTAGFKLGDSSRGDYFQITVDRDITYGTYVFTPKGGIASCPQEPNFGLRDRPKLNLKLSPVAAVLPDEPAIFLFEIANNADEQRTYVMTAHLVDLQDDAKITVDGMTLDEPRVFEDLPPLHKTEALIKIFRGSRLFSYSLKVTLKSICDSTAKDEHVLVVNFIPPCPPVALTGRLATDGYITLNVNSPSFIVPLAARNLDETGLPWLNNSRVVAAKFEYRYVGFADWEDLFVSDGGKDVVLQDDPVFHIGTYGWDLTNLPEMHVKIELRAVVQCGAVPGIIPSDHPELFRKNSMVGTIIVDRIPPRVVDSRELGTVYPGARIDIEFTEPVRCGSGNKIPYSVNLVVIGLEDVSFTATTGNLMVECVDSRISVIPTSNTIELFGKDAILTITNVKDLAGNKAESNVVKLHSGFLNDPLLFGVVERRFRFGQVDIATTSYFAAGLLFPLDTFVVGSGNTNDVVFVNGVVSTTLAVVLGGIDPQRIHVERFSFENGFCIADVVIVALGGSGKMLPTGAPTLGGARLRSLQTTSYVDNVDIGEALLALILPGTGYALVETGKVGVAGVTDRDSGETQLVILTSEIERVDQHLFNTDVALNNKLDLYLTNLNVRLDQDKSDMNAKLVALQASVDAISVFLTHKLPSASPSKQPTTRPSKSPHRTPSRAPSRSPRSMKPSKTPSGAPSKAPKSSKPTKSPSQTPSKSPKSSKPTGAPSLAPSKSPKTSRPSVAPVASKPSKSPSHAPSKAPKTSKPSKSPSHSPSRSPKMSKPSRSPSRSPTKKVVG